MNKKGFTLIEVLAVIVIIGLLSGVGIIAYQSFFMTSRERYFAALEDDVLLASNDYFVDNRDQLPIENQFNKISLAELIDNKYMEPVKDSKGNLCTDGDVYIYQENGKYSYEVCLRCEGRIPSGKYQNKIK